MNLFIIGVVISVGAATAENVDAPKRRYLLYDCNPGEGFNLRRDVYIRISNLVKYLNTKEPWTLVLPPWGGIGYHWQERELEQSRIPWSMFFDIESLNRHISVIEYADYIETMGEAVIDELWYLQGYAEGIDFDNWEDKIDERPCIDPPAYETDDEGKVRGWFWGYRETYAKKFKCVSMQGPARTTAPSLLGGNTTATSVMLDRAENLLHDMYGGKDYWDARRSMVFSRMMRMAGDDFRKLWLNSSDTRDKTVMPANWQDNKRKEGAALGGPYIAAHLRRKDFLYSRPKDVPSLERVAKILRSLARDYDATTIFIASDGTEEEMKQLEYLIPIMMRFKPTPMEDRNFKKGGIAIIDQIICSHARYFIGTHESTFTFRITEEREIMGFSEETTYNRFCSDSEETCDRMTKWKIVWEDDREIWT